MLRGQGCAERGEDGNIIGEIREDEEMMRRLMCEQCDVTLSDKKFKKELRTSFDIEYVSDVARH